MSAVMALVLFNLVAVRRAPLPTSVCEQTLGELSLANPPWVGAMSTRDSWPVNRRRPMH